MSTSVRSAEEIWSSSEDLHTNRRIGFGIPAVDSALGGGLVCGKISELYGDPGAGKTQLALTLVAQELINNHLGGDDGIIIYLHSSGTFPIERLCEIIEAKLCASDDSTATDPSIAKGMLSSLCIDKAVEGPELNQKLLNLTSNAEDSKKIRLLVLDSIASVFRPLLRTKKLCDNFTPNLLHTVYLMKRIASQFQMPVLVLNEVAGGSDPSTNSTKSGMPVIKPALGDIWTHAINCRVAIHHMKDVIHRRRYLQIIFNADGPPSDKIPIAITSCGVKAQKLNVK